MARLAGYLGTMKTKAIVTAEVIEQTAGTTLGVTERLPNAGRARSYINRTTGIMVERNPTIDGFGALLNRKPSPLAPGYYVLIAEGQHAMVGRVFADRRRFILDVQARARKTWERAMERWGRIDAYKVRF